jgi:hypothetical protein
MMIVPLVLLDISMEIYHRICFPLYGIDYVNRKEYIKIDRHRLSYLTGLEKINCAYCGYANGLMHYASIIAGETERYWCSIKHEEDSNFLPPQHHNDFLEHGNKDGLIELTADEYLQD